MKNKSTAFYVLLFSLLIINTSCFEMPDDFILPEWDVDLNVPFINTNYTVAEIVGNQKNITNPDVQDSLYILESDRYDVNAKFADYISLTNFTAIQNSPVIVQDSVSQTIYIPFPEGAEVDSAVFQSGTLIFDVDNPSAETVFINFVLPGIYKPDGSIVVIEMIVSPSNSQLVQYDISNHTYKVPQSQPPALRNNLALNIEAGTQNGATASVFISFSSSEFLFSMFAGKIPPQSLGVRRRAFQFISGNLLGFRDNIFLREADMQISANIFSEFSNPFPGELRQFNIIGKRNSGGEFFLEDGTGNSNFLIRIDNGVFNGYFDETNSNIAEFIAFLPDSIILKGEYIMNPDFDQGAVSINDSVFVEDFFTSKSMLALKRSNLIDTSQVDISEADRIDIANSRSLSLFLEVENAIPLATWLKVDLYDSSFNHLLTLTANSNGTDSLFVQAAEIDLNGEVSAPFQNPPVVMQLDAEQIDLFARATSAIYSVNINTTDAFNNPPEFVAIRPSAWLHVRAYGTIKYHIDPDDL